MEFKKLEEETKYHKVIVLFKVELPDSRTIEYWKSAENDSVYGNYDFDEGFETDKDKATYDSLSEEEQEEFMEFVGAELTL